MTTPSFPREPSHIDEPRVTHEYADVLMQVASEHRPVIVRRNGVDLAAVIPLEHLELLREVLARQDVEHLAAQIDWDRLVQTHQPPQAWFEDDDNPCEPEEELT
jgi:prevent-host-death family protein